MMSENPKLRVRILIAHIQASNDEQAISII